MPVNSRPERFVSVTLGNVSFPLSCATWPAVMKVTSKRPSGRGFVRMGNAVPVVLSGPSTIHTRRTDAKGGLVT